MRTKQRIIVLVLALITLNTAVNAQLSAYNGKRPIIIEQNEVRHIEVTGNVGMVLRQEKGDGVNLRIGQEFVDKVKVTVHDGKLTITAKDNQPADERLIVYGYFDNLESLTVSGNVIVASVGILNFDNLMVNMDNEAKVNIRTVGKIWIKAQDDSRYVQRPQYYSLETGDRK